MRAAVTDCVVEVVAVIVVVLGAKLRSAAVDVDNAEPAARSEFAGELATADFGSDSF